MEDVNTQAQATDVAPVEPVTTQPEPQQVNETTDTSGQKPAVQEAQERMVPIRVVQEERKQRHEAQRKLAEYEQKSKLSQYDPNDTEALMAHPFVQELLIKQAKSELTTYAREKLDGLPQVPEAVKKAILANVRGFVKETTSDVDSAKIDIDEYIESLLEEVTTQPQPKVIPVASTQQKESASGATPMAVQEILETPVDEWTDEQAKIVDQYKRTQPKR